MYFKWNSLCKICVVTLILSLMGCSSSGKEVTNTESPMNVVQEQMNFEHVEGVALNNQNAVISNENILSELNEILIKMELDVYTQSNDNNKKGFQILTFTYDDGSFKQLCISVNGMITISNVSYSISNQVEIMDEISALFEKYAK